MFALQIKYLTEGIKVLKKIIPVLKTKSAKSAMGNFISISSANFSAALLQNS